MYSDYSLSEIRAASQQLNGIFSTITKVLGKVGTNLSKIGTLAIGAAQAGVNAGFINPNNPLLQQQQAAWQQAAQQAALQQAASQQTAPQNITNKTELPSWLIPAVIGGLGLLLITRKK